MPLHAPDQRGKEVNPMAPLYTLLLCLPAVLILITCACGLAVLGAPTAPPPVPPTVGRTRGGSIAP